MASLREVTLYAATVESVKVTVDTDADPTGTAPQFALSAVEATAPGNFSTGSWSGSWASATGYTDALTPTIGSGGTLVIASGSRYWVWVKVTLSGEVAVWPAFELRCP